MWNTEILEENLGVWGTGWEGHLSLLNLLFNFLNIVPCEYIAYSKKYIVIKRISTPLALGGVLRKAQALARHCNSQHFPESRREAQWPSQDGHSPGSSLWPCTHRAESCWSRKLALGCPWDYIGAPQPSLPCTFQHTNIFFFKNKEFLFNRTSQ